MKRSVMLAALALAGCQGFVDAMACDDEARSARTPVTVYETSCYGGLAMTCVTRPRTEWLETAESRRLMQGCLARRRVERNIAAAPPPAPRTDWPAPAPPSPANARGWYAAGGAVLRQRPAFDGTPVQVLQYGQTVIPMAAPTGQWVRVALDDGRAGWLPLASIWQR